MNNDCLFCKFYDGRCVKHCNEPMEHRCLEYEQVSQEEIRERGLEYDSF